MDQKLIQSSGFWIKSCQSLENELTYIQNQVPRIQSSLSKCFEKDYQCPISKYFRDEISVVAVLLCCGNIEEPSVLKSWLRNHGNGICPICRKIAKFICISPNRSGKLQKIQEWVFRKYSNFQIVFCPNELISDITFEIEKSYPDNNWIAIGKDDSMKINFSQILPSSQKVSILVVGKLNTRVQQLIRQIREHTKSFDTTRV